MNRNLIDLARLNGVKAANDLSLVQIAFESAAKVGANGLQDVTDVAMEAISRVVVRSPSTGGILENNPDYLRNTALISLVQSMKAEGKSLEKIKKDPTVKANTRSVRSRLIDQELSELRQDSTARAVVAPARYERLLAKLKAATEKEELTSDSKRRVIQALVQEVRVTPTGFQLSYFAGVEQVKAGEALASSAESLKDKKYVPRSCFQLNGGRSGIVVEPLVVVREYRLQWARRKWDEAELASHASAMRPGYVHV